MGVFQRARSPFWHLWLEGAPDGQQLLKTKIRIGTTPEQKAESRALADNLYHREMLQLAADRHSLVGPIAKDRTLAEQIDWHLAHVTPQHAGAERERDILARLRTMLGDRPLRSMDRRAAMEYASRRLTTPTTIAKKRRTAARSVTATESTVNRELDVLKAVLRDAVPTYLAVSPLYGMKRLRLKGKPRRRVLTPDEERRLLAALEPADRAIVIMGMDTLCRLSDILNLKRSDDHGATLYIRSPKGGEPYEPPVSKRLRKALDAMPDAGEYYFAHRRKAKTVRDRRAAIRTLLKRTCQALDIPYGRKHGGITFHWATRRTGATRMIQAGVDVRTVQEIGNWKQPGVLLEIYAESNAAARQKAVNLVGPKRRRA